MIGIVIVSHSQKLAEGVVELAKIMAPAAQLEAAGGLDYGGIGNSRDDNGNGHGRHAGPQDQDV